jgi:hypothetical protein
MPINAWDDGTSYSKHSVVWVILTILVVSTSCARANTIPATQYHGYAFYCGFYSFEIGPTWDRLTLFIIRQSPRPCAHS